MIRKIFGVLNNHYLDDESHLKVFKAACRLGEHICIDIIIHYQNRQELLYNFWSMIGIKNPELIKPGLICFKFAFILIIAYLFRITNKFIGNDHLNFSRKDYLIRKTPRSYDFIKNSI